MWSLMKNWLVNYIDVFKEIHCHFYRPTCMSVCKAGESEVQSSICD